MVASAFVWSLGLPLNLSFYVPNTWFLIYSSLHVCSSLKSFCSKGPTFHCPDHTFSLNSQPVFLLTAVCFIIHNFTGTVKAILLFTWFGSFLCIYVAPRPSNLFLSYGLLFVIGLPQKPFLPSLYRGGTREVWEGATHLTPALPWSSKSCCSYTFIVNVYCASRTYNILNLERCTSNSYK